MEDPDRALLASVAARINASNYPNSGPVTGDTRVQLSNGTYEFLYRLLSIRPPPTAAPSISLTSQVLLADGTFTTVAQILALASGSSGGSLLLDSITSTVVAAYGLRKLRAGYSGPCLQTTVGGSTHDIGFVSGVVDIATMLGYGSTATVSKLYDQSGNGYDLVQSTTANQPQIVVSSAVTALGNTAAKPAIKFVGSGTKMAMATASANVALGTSNIFSSHIVASTGSGISGSARLASYIPSGGPDDSSYNTSAIFALFTSATSYLFFRAGNSASQTITSAPYQAAAVSAAGANGMQVTINGSAGTAAGPDWSGAGASMGSPGTLLLGGQLSDVSKFDGMFAEMIVLEGAPAPGDQATIRTSQKTFYGTP